MSTIAEKTSEARQSSRGEAKRFSLGGNAIIQAGIALLALALWEASSRVFHLDFWTSSPSAIVMEL